MQHPSRRYSTLHQHPIRILDSGQGFPYEQSIARVIQLRKLSDSCISVINDCFDTTKQLAVVSLKSQRKKSEQFNSSSVLQKKC
jgi:hypothetical protein